MNITFAKDRLLSVLTDFYTFTGMTVTVFDSNCTKIVAYPEQMQSYCQKVREDSTRHRNCLLSDLNAFETCRLTGETYTYTCHAGVCESVTPVYFNSHLVAYIIFGQFADSELEYSSKESVRVACEKYALDTAKMLKKYEQLPAMSHAHIHAANNIIGVFITKILLERMIHIELDSLSEEVNNYVDAHFADTALTVDSISKALHISRKKLYMVFENNFGTTVKSHITAKRMAKAAQLLEETDLPIYEISEKVGIENYNNFIQLFKRAQGITPLQYRKLKQA